MSPTISRRLDENPRAGPKNQVNLYRVYFVSKGTGPRTVQIEAQNSAGVRAQVEARYPGAYNIISNLLPTSAKKKRE